MLLGDELLLPRPGREAAKPAVDLAVQPGQRHGKQAERKQSGEAFPPFSAKVMFSGLESGFSG